MDSLRPTKRLVAFRVLLVAVCTLCSWGLGLRLEVVSCGAAIPALVSWQLALYQGYSDSLAVTAVGVSTLLGVLASGQFGIVQGAALTSLTCAALLGLLRNWSCIKLTPWKDARRLAFAIVLSGPAVAIVLFLVAWSVNAIHPLDLAENLAKVLLIGSLASGLVSSSFLLSRL